MCHTEILPFIRATPFQPVRIRMIGGEQFTIQRPGMAIVTPTFVAVGVPRSGGGNIAERIVHLALSHIECIEKIQETSTK